MHLILTKCQYDFTIFTHLRIFELLLEIERKNGLHAIVRESLTKFISNNEEDAVGIRQLLKKRKLIYYPRYWTVLIGLYLSNCCNREI